jgi:hypothetical protein
MKKAVLLMDVPETCLDCNLCVLDMDGSISCYYNKREICSNVEENNSRPEWCPLRELPEEDHENHYPDEWEDGYADGWNDCLREIAGQPKINR